jgi:hypothetical protein
MKALRDISKTQFLAALERHGMKSVGFMGYVEMGDHDHRISVSHHNAGPRLRSKLANLLTEKDKWEKKIAEEEKAQGGL